MIKELNAAVVDDDAESRKFIVRMVESIFSAFDFKIQFKTYPNAETFLPVISSNCFDFIFLDIEMPGLSGIDLAKKMKADKLKTRIIYVSNRQDLIFESLETRPYGFVRKSNFNADLEKIVSFFANEVKEEEGNYLILQTVSETVNVNVEDIIYIEAFKRDKYVYVKGINEPYVSTTTFETFSEQLLDKGFIVCYRGVMVNYRFVKAIYDDNIELKNGKIVPMSRRLATETKQKYLNLLKKHTTFFC